MFQKRSLSAIAVTAMLASGLAAFSGARAAVPDGGTLSETSGPVTWTGETVPISTPASGAYGCVNATDPRCDHFDLLLQAPSAGGYTLEIEVAADAEGDDFDLTVFDAGGQRLAVSSSADSPERVVLADPPSGHYTVSVSAFGVLNPVGGYHGTADLAGPGEGDTFNELRIDTVVQKCLEPAPVILGAQGITDDGDRVSLDVLILLDEPELFEGVTSTAEGVAKAADIVEKAKMSYRELGVDFRAVGYEVIGPVAPSAGLEHVVDFNGGSRPGIYADELFAASRAAVGGVRPKLWEGKPVDIVYTMTGKELYSRPDATDDGKGLLGQASCIGGVRFDEEAFAVGEAWADRLSGIPSQTNANVIVIAHEIGHLMGAHHHYGECVTGQRPHEANGRLDPQHPCTLMFPSAGPNNLPFSGLNSAVVRGHAFGFAHQND